MTEIDFIQNKTNLPHIVIQNVINLIAEGCTIPFIARYRKDQTQNLDEVMIEIIEKTSHQYHEIQKRKQTILHSIEEQDALTPELSLKIQSCFSTSELEDLYLPYKKRRKTKADIAREQGLEPLAKIIMSQNTEDLSAIAQRYINNEIKTSTNAIDGALDIIAEWVNENTFIRQALRNKFVKHSLIKTKVVKNKQDEAEAQKYAQYFQHEESLYRIPAHRLLACMRAENEGFVKISVNIDKDEAVDFISKKIIKNHQHSTTPFIQKAIADAYKRLLEPSLSSEALQEAKHKADTQSIAVFADNLSQLLLASPLGGKRVLAIDPGYKTGCKVVCINENGELLHNENIYPHPPQKEIAIAKKKIRSLCSAYKVEAIAIGNGTASRETETFIKSIAFDKPIQVFVVNEAGASVYSASKIAREEFPNYDITVRGAVSIGRRLQDPLAELVKIDPKSIGVGQYQHDVNPTMMKESLAQVVTRCVNTVGVNLNTASKSLLSYVSGIGEKLAENIVNYRAENGNFHHRTELKKVPRLGDKAYEQAVAFLRIPNAENPLDNSAIHPEAYGIINKIAKNYNLSVEKLIGNKEIISKINPQDFVTNTMGELYIQDLLKELEKPGLDPRKTAKIFEFHPDIKTIDDLKEGMILPAIVNNITNFGCFVDIGIKESGLIHISQLKQGYVEDVNQVVKLHQHITVKVIAIDLNTKRINLSLML